MLRESSKLEGIEVDLQVVTNGQGEGEGEGEGERDREGEAIKGEQALLAFAESALYFDHDATRIARDKLCAVLGEAAMIDSACIIANFQRMVRISDGTGIPLDTPVAMITADLREELGINQFGSAGNTPKVTGIKKVLGRLLNKMLPFLFRQMANKSETSSRNSSGE